MTSIDDMPPLEAVDDTSISTSSNHQRNPASINQRRVKRKRGQTQYQTEDLSISPSTPVHWSISQHIAQQSHDHISHDDLLSADDSNSSSSSSSLVQQPAADHHLLSADLSAPSRCPSTEVVELSSDDDDDDSDVESIDVKRVVDLTDETNPLLSDSPARRVQTRIRYINVIVPQPAPPPVDLPPAHPCPVCLSECVEMSALKCGHIACAGCLQRTIELYQRCPVCRHKASMKDVRRLFI